MRSIGVRQLVFGLMVLSVAACGFAYAGGTRRRGPALCVCAKLPTASTPAPPIVIRDWTTPTENVFYWEADMTIAGVATPDLYYVVADGVVGLPQPALPAENRVRHVTGLDSRLHAHL